MVESGLVFLFMWNNVKCSGTHLGCDFTKRKKKVCPEAPPVGNHWCRVCSHTSSDNFSERARGPGTAEQLSEPFVYRSASKQGGKDRGELKHETSAAAFPHWGKFSRELGIFTQTPWGRRLNNSRTLSGAFLACSWPAAAWASQWTTAPSDDSVKWVLALSDSSHVRAVQNRQLLLVSLQVQRKQSSKAKNPKVLHNSPVEQKRVQRHLAFVIDESKRQL